MLMLLNDAKYSWINYVLSFVLNENSKFKLDVIIIKMDFSLFFRPPGIDFTALGEPELK